MEMNKIKYGYLVPRDLQSFSEMGESFKEEQIFLLS